MSAIEGYGDFCGMASMTQAPQVRLISDEVTTLFHEFGHAPHGLLSDIEYPSFVSRETPPDGTVKKPASFGLERSNDATAALNIAQI